MGNLFGKEQLYIPTRTELKRNILPLPGDVSELRSVFGTRLVLPNDDLYHNARFGITNDKVTFTETWNLDVIGFPAAIASCQSVADVQAVVRYCAKHLVGNEQIKIAVACGRHSHSCMVDNSLVIDLSGLRHVTVDAEKKIAVVHGGALMGDLDAATMPHNLSVTAGHNATTGCGLIGGGGRGFLERRFGMTIDSLIEAEVVTPDGEVCIANAETNPDLFWALRGGGGNFGVVTKYILRLHDFPNQVFAGPLIHIPVGWLKLIDRDVVILEFCKLVNDEAPDEATGMLILPAGGPAIEYLMWAGSPKHGMDYFEYHRKNVGMPIDKMKVRNYQMEVQRANPVDQAQAYQTGLLFKEITPEIAKIMADLVLARNAPSVKGVSGLLVIIPSGGAAGRVAKDATANPHRDLRFWLLVLTGWKAAYGSEHYAEQRKSAADWVRHVKDALLPHSAGQYAVLGEVATHGDTESADGTETMGKMMANVRNIYGENLPRLREIKTKYDPHNLFRLNDNILPL